MSETELKPYGGECPECGSKDVYTQIEPEELEYANTNLTFFSLTPVNHCRECDFTWMDENSFEVREKAQKEFEAKYSDTAP